MSLHDYAAWWKQHKAGLDHRLLYLKDWHFVNEFPEYQARITLQQLRIACTAAPACKDTLLNKCSSNQQRSVNV